MKSKEELAALKEEVEALNKKPDELSKEELAQVSGGEKRVPSECLEPRSKVIALEPLSPPHPHHHDSGPVAIEESLVNMITSQRAYATNSKALTTSDAGLEEILNQR